MVLHLQNLKQILQVENPMVAKMMPLLQVAVMQPIQIKEKDKMVMMYFQIVRERRLEIESAG
jgi:hypothetical protein